MTNEKEIDEMSLEELEEYENSLDKKLKIKSIESKQKMLEPSGAKENFVTNSGGERKTTYADDEQGLLVDWAVKNSLKSYKDMWENTDSDASCPDDYSDWTPTEFFSSYILGSLGTNCDLASLCRLKVDLGAGKGDKVVFRTTSARTATGDLGGCECISCCSTGWGKKEVTVKRFADNNIICEFDSWKSLGTKEAELKEMQKGAERFVDKEIFDAINESTPGFNVDLPVAMNCSGKYPDGSCCSVSSGLYLYTAIIDLLTEMREANYEPDALLIAPSVAAFFKYKDSIDIPFIMRGGLELDENGRLAKLAGLKVIECNHMSSCSDATGQVLAYAIQSDRSVGIVWGQEPKFYEIYDGQCDSWSVGYNAYFGVDSLDDNSIGTVSNA